MSKIHQFDLNPYPRKLWIAINPSKEEVNNMFINIDETPLDLDDDINAPIAACTFPSCWNQQNGLYGSLLILDDNPTIEYIAHEATHIVASLFDSIGSFLDPNNQEPFAYMVGYVADCINQVKTNKFKE